MISKKYLVASILTLTLTSSVLAIEEAQPLDPEVVQSLYIESALFVAVFTIMSIISIVISKKHAAQNLENDRKKREAKAEIERAQEEAEKSSPKASVEEPEKTARVSELSKMLEDGLISEEEFKILSKASQEKSN